MDDIQGNLVRLNSKGCIVLPRRGQIRIYEGKVIEIREKTFEVKFKIDSTKEEVWVPTTQLEMSEEM